MMDIIGKILDSEFPSLLSILALLAGSTYFSIVVLPKLKRLEELENSPPSQESLDKVIDDLKKVSESQLKLAADFEQFLSTTSHQQDMLDDIQYSCHNTRHELADIKGRMHNIASSLSTDGRDDLGFCDLRELR